MRLLARREGKHEVKEAGDSHHARSFRARHVGCILRGTTCARERTLSTRATNRERPRRCEPCVLARNVRRARVVRQRRVVALALRRRDRFLWNMGPSDRRDVRRTSLLGPRARPRMDERHLYNTRNAGSCRRARLRRLRIGRRPFFRHVDTPEARSDLARAKRRRAKNWRDARRLLHRHTRCTRRARVRDGRSRRTKTRATFFSERRRRKNDSRAHVGNVADARQTLSCGDRSKKRRAHSRAPAQRSWERFAFVRRWRSKLSRRPPHERRDVRLRTKRGRRVGVGRIGRRRRRARTLDGSRAHVHVGREGTHFLSSSQRTKTFHVLEPFHRSRLRDRIIERRRRHDHVAHRIRRRARSRVVRRGRRNVVRKILERHARDVHHDDGISVGFCAAGCTERIRRRIERTRRIGRIFVRAIVELRVRCDRVRVALVRRRALRGFFPRGCSRSPAHAGSPSHHPT